MGTYCPSTLQQFCFGVLVLSCWYNNQLYSNTWIGLN